MPRMPRTGCLLALIALIAACKRSEPQPRPDATTPLRPRTTPPEEGESAHVQSSCMAAFEACGADQEACAASLASACRHGTPLWIRHATGAGPGLGLARVKEDGSALVTGAFSGDATFGQGEKNTVTLRSTTGADEDMFVARYGLDGALLWARRAGGRSTDTGIAVATLADQGAFVAGSLFGQATFGQGERNDTTITADRAALFLARYDHEGALCSSTTPMELPRSGRVGSPSRPTAARY